MKILIDNGHGIDTKGKRSLDDQQSLVDLHIDGIISHLDSL